MMKPSAKGLGLVLGTLMIISFRVAWAQNLWEGDVTAITSSVSPVPTVEVSAGTMLAISASIDDEWRLFGDILPPLYQWTNADGLYGFEHEGVLIGSLVGKIGDSGDWFFIGTDFSGGISQTGMLYLACWDYPGAYGDNEDFIHVTVTEISKGNPADLDHDRDVDGVDLFRYISETSLVFLYEMADAFGLIEITNNADLGGLSVSSGNLDPAFSPDRTGYLVTVGSDVDTFQVTPVLSDPLAELMINGSPADSGEPFPVSLETGSNYIEIKVTSKDSTVEKTYSILAVRSGHASLSGIDIPVFGLNPAFSPGTKVYAVEVDQTVTTIDITPEADDPGSVIEVNDLPIISGNTMSVLLDEGISEITVRVTAADSSQVSYFVYVKRQTAAAATVFVVDTADGPDEFETLTQAMDYLNTHLLAGQVGHIRIQSTSPLPVDVLNITGNIMVTVDPGACGIISGPPGSALVINTSGGWDVSGLSFVNSPGFTINASGGLTVFGSSFSADTTVNLNGSAGTVSKGSGSFDQGFNFTNGSLSGYLNVNLYGSTDSSCSTVGTSASGISFTGYGSFAGDAGLIFKANPVSSLNITAALKGNSRAQIIGHTSLSRSGFDVDMEETAAVYVEQHTSALLEAVFKGLKGQMELKNVTTANAALHVDMAHGDYTGNANSIMDFNLDLSYTHGLSHFGFTEKGGKAYHTFVFNGKDAPSNGELVLGFDGFDFKGKTNLHVGGKGKITFENGTILEAEAYLDFSGNIADLELYDIHGKAMLLVTFPDSGVQAYLSAERSKLDRGIIFDPVPETFHGSMDTITTVTGGVRIGLGGNPAPGEEAPLSYSEEAPLTDNTLVLNNLDITDANGQPGLYIKGISVPVTISNSSIKADLWSIVCSGIDADVTIENNSNLEGGIFLDGDPEGSGAMMSRQYTVSGNTITQNYSGGSCLSSHAIRDVAVNSNDMSAFAPGAAGILLSGGKMVVNSGSILTLGSYFGIAIGVGPSAGNANGILYADSVEPITGSINPSEMGYVKLTDNTFSNAIVFDYNVGDVGRLLNNPVEDNSGLNPDEHVKGSLIDWNDDNHHCPDYPTRCDEWDEDMQECGCGEDGIDPPSEPGI